MIDGSREKKCGAASRFVRPRVKIKARTENEVMGLGSMWGQGIGHMRGECVVRRYQETACQWGFVKDARRVGEDAREEMKNKDGKQENKPNATERVQSRISKPVSTRSSHALNPSS
jgi:hypothetical protein